MTDWKWYLTPSIGVFGAALQVQDMPTGERQIRKITPIQVGSQGQVGFMKWVGQETGMCEPVGNVSSWVLFPATEKVIPALEDIWNRTGAIINPGNGRLRLS